MPVDALLRDDAFLTREILKLALETSGIGVWKVDPRTREVELTAPLKQIFGLPADQPVDYAVFFQLLHPDDRDGARAGLADAFDLNGSGLSQVEFRILTPSQDVRWLQGRGQAFFEETAGARVPALFIGTLRDITESKTNEAAQQALMEHQETLIHEVNHRVKNSLQLVSSLLRLQARQINDPDSRRQLEDATSRISTIAQIHQRLYRDKDTRRINFGAFLTEHCSDLQASSPNCSLEVQTPDFMITTDRAIPLALVVNELVTNAFKYAYPGSFGPVKVEVDLPEAGGCVIRVIDHGVGVPDGFSIDKTRSLGMILVSSLVGQLGGKVDLLRDAESGACFVVTIPGEHEGPRDHVPQA